jgi:hypothetical protein
VQVKVAELHAWPVAEQSTQVLPGGPQVAAFPLSGWATQVPFESQHPLHVLALQFPEVQEGTTAARNPMNAPRERARILVIRFGAPRPEIGDLKPNRAAGPGPGGKF